MPSFPQQKVYYNIENTLFAGDFSFRLLNEWKFSNEMNDDIGTNSMEYEIVGSVVYIGCCLTVIDTTHESVTRCTCRRTAFTQFQLAVLKVCWCCYRKTALGLHIDK